LQPDANTTAERLTAAGVAVLSVSVETLGVVVRLEPGCAEPALAVLRADGYEMLVDLFATDTGEALDLTYHLRDLDDLREVFVKVAVAYDGEAPSVWSVCPAALSPAREAAELLGMSFAGHPNPKRLLTSDEVVSPLLRKSVAIRTGEEVALP
jgi:NADH:ubiquinone oxidoreductase subunit C